MSDQTTVEQTITHLSINNNDYVIAADQSRVHNLAVHFNEETGGITNLINAIEGEENIQPSASGFRTIAIGPQSQATSDYCIAVGKECHAGPVPQGEDEQVSEGSPAIAIGMGSKATNNQTLSIGFNNSQAAGENSISMGVNAQTTPEGINAIAIGSGAQAIAEGAVAIGSFVCADHPNSTILGQYNSSGQDGLVFAIGIGTNGADDITGRRNALEIYKNGEAVWAVEDLMPTPAGFENTFSQKYTVTNDTWTTNGLITTPEPFVKEHILAAKSDYLDIMVFFQNGEIQTLVKILGKKTNCYVQIYENNNVQFYHYTANDNQGTNSAWTLMSLNNIGIEGSV